MWYMQKYAAILLVMFRAIVGLLYKFSVILIGTSAVGKTSIVQRYCDDIFNTQSLTVGIDMRVKKFEMNNNVIEVS